MKTQDVVMLVLLAAVWGASFLFMRVAAPVLGPFMTITLRVGVAAIALIVYARITHQTIDLARNWKPYFVMGLLNAAIPFTLIAAALLNLNASLGSILNATATFFTTLVAAVWLKDAMNMRKTLGIVIGFIGVVVLVGWNPVPLTLATLLSVGAMLVATFLYGIAACYAKTVKGVKPFAFATGQQIGASAWMLPVALVTWPPPQAPTPLVFGAVVALGLLSTVVAYLLYYRLIANVGPAKAVTTTFLIPFFGILWGAIFLGEAITLNVIVGLFIILVGMTLALQLPLPFLQPRVQTA